MESKKAWQKPELIILVRAKPEEAVLAACKFVVVGPAEVLFCYRPPLGVCDAISQS